MGFVGEIIIGVITEAAGEMVMGVLKAAANGIRGRTASDSPEPAEPEPESEFISLNLSE